MAAVSVNTLCSKTFKDNCLLNFFDVFQYDFLALSQVKDFLPLMKKAQEELSNTDHNMENIDEDEPCISMVIILRFYKKKLSKLRY